MYPRWWVCKAPGSFGASSFPGAVSITHGLKHTPKLLLISSSTSLSSYSYNNSILFILPEHHRHHSVCSKIQQFSHHGGMPLGRLVYIKYVSGARGVHFQRSWRSFCWRALSQQLSNVRLQAIKELDGKHFGLNIWITRKSVSLSSGWLEVSWYLEHLFYIRYFVIKLSHGQNKYDLAYEFYYVIY